MESGTVTCLMIQADPLSGLTLPALLDRHLVRYDRLQEWAPGDGCCLLFQSVAEAVSAACSLRKSMASEPSAGHWEQWIRMAVHTGTGGVRPVAERGLAIAATAAGGQILLSAAALGETTMRHQPLGALRLRDLRSVEQVHLLHCTADETAVPVPRTLDSLPNNLPAQTTSFVGRRREMAELKGLLESGRLVTLTGPGGNGKTRMALQTGAELLERFVDGVWLTELAGVTEPDRVVQAVASVLGVREEPGRPPLETLCEHLAAKQLLLLLDNCEHLVAAAAQLAATLLARAPHLRILATSREPLSISGETAWPMPTLAAEDEAVRLFLERALCVSPTFALTVENRAAVTDICRRLDGVPLAIELAAARVRVLSVEQIAQRLDQRLRLLTAGDRTAPPRHQTLRATIDWSYELLSEQERALWRRLSVFVGSFALEAAESVCGDDDVLARLAQLVDKSLVVPEEQKGEKRYRLLETMREYAMGKLHEAGEEPALRRAHRDWYLAFAERAEPELMGTNQSLWLDRLGGDHENLRQALGWSLEAGEVDQALRMGAALWRFWYVRGHFSENRDRLTRLADLPGPVGSLQARAKVLNGAGALFYYLADFARAREYFLKSLAVWRDLGDKLGVGRALNNLGVLARTATEFELALEYLEESLRLSRELGNRTAQSWTMNNLGSVRFELGDQAAARSLQEAALEIQQAQGDQWGIAMSSEYLGYVALRDGDLAGAAGLFEAALSIRRSLGDQWGIGVALGGQGDVAFEQGDLDRARRLHMESIRVRQRLGDLLGVAQSLETLSRVAGAGGHAALAGSLGAAAGELRRRIGAPRPPLRKAPAGANEPVPPGDVAAWIDLACAPVPLSQRPPEPGPQLLTAREQEIAALAAAGLTAKEIGQRLHLSSRTVEKHEENIRLKLEVPNRAGIVAWAVRRGMAGEAPR
ncbi:MAG TPA: tetratricopeptide repeat protein [Symbiobacteriaceae bacterium]|nr:tetratricopeptide repeat protein [Symbiobacteriaceae bacterium]